jgi:CxxC-x17-CxxC domain-containing protein
MLQSETGGKIMFEDKVLVCVDCGKEFIWTAGEQEFYAERGFQNEPKRCPDCRKNRKSQRNGGANGERVMYDAVCARCGKPCKVPFQPSGDRPVYCSECFAEMKADRDAR